jgi:hypothetical protein
MSIRNLLKLSPFIILSAMNLVSLSARAEGGTSGGGGDGFTEMRIDEIRGDILKWIGEGGAQELKLPDGISYGYYRDVMARELQPHAVVIGGVTAADESTTTDPELKVMVSGQPKTCRGFISKKDNLPHILCNVERFAGTPESQQYALIHHEYAGLALIEKNIGASSDYFVSSQLTSYLVVQKVLRLAVKAAPQKVFHVTNGRAQRARSEFPLSHLEQGGLIQIKAPLFSDIIYGNPNNLACTFYDHSRKIESFESGVRLDNREHGREIKLPPGRSLKVKGARNVEATYRGNDMNAFVYRGVAIEFDDSEIKMLVCRSWGNREFKLSTGEVEGLLAGSVEIYVPAVQILTAKGGASASARTKYVRVPKGANAAEIPADSLIQLKTSIYSDVDYTRGGDLKCTIYDHSREITESDRTREETVNSMNQGYKGEILASRVIKAGEVYLPVKTRGEFGYLPAQGRALQIPAGYVLKVKGARNSFAIYQGDEWNAMMYHATIIELDDPSLKMIICRSWDKQGFDLGLGQIQQVMGGLAAKSPAN